MALNDVAAGQPSPFSRDDYNSDLLPDHDTEFLESKDVAAFVKALQAPDDPLKSPELVSSPRGKPVPFITALNDWRPIRQRVRKDQPRPKRKRRKKTNRGKDETREGFVYTLLKWPLLLFVLGWIICLAAGYAVTRLYIWAYEAGVTVRGRREAFTKRLHGAKSYDEWVIAAKDMDRYLGNDDWKRKEDYAYYNSDTIRTVRDHLHHLRIELIRLQASDSSDNIRSQMLAEELRSLLESSVKNNFVGVENARLYSETYYGTKDLIQSFLSEVSSSLHFLSTSEHLSDSAKSTMYGHLSTNYGRTALCLSGGATFAYYHFGVAKALLDAKILPNIITGTSGGALVAALLCTRTDEELQHCLVPALAHRINACREPITTTTRRWWRTGAQFDSIDWAKRCSWFCRGSLTFREAYERTGRILNITCIPSDPHSPTVLANYLTSPDCVIWSAVLASAAVPGILNPVVLMRKNARTGQLEPYSFGHKWKDGSLRTDIPLRALNTHFNVTYSIVSQVNPHINLFFFSSRGTVGRPVTHRRGRGWRGGFLGSATEQYLKLDLNKWLKVLRHLELIPRYAEQDWSNIWLQRFDGSVTIWPRSATSDFWHILSDPSKERLARMLWAGMQSAWPKVKFVRNRMMVEGAIQDGLQKYGGPGVNGFGAAGDGRAEGIVGGVGLEGLRGIPSEEEFALALKRSKVNNSATGALHPARANSDPQHRKRHSWVSEPPPIDTGYFDQIQDENGEHDSISPMQLSARRGSSILQELGRQASVFRGDDTEGETGATNSETSDVEGDGDGDGATRHEAMEGKRKRG